MTKEESKEDPSELIYDLLECFMMTWEELMGMASVRDSQKSLGASQKRYSGNF